MDDRQTEEKIFDAATEVFIEKGMDGARMQDIADRAGMNKSLLHYYYRSKDRLFNAVFESIASKILSKFAPVMDPSLTIEDKIRFFFREHIDFLAKNPGLPVFLMNEINRNPDRIKKLIQQIEIDKLWNSIEKLHRDELANYNISKEMFPQLLTSIAAMSVFPFAARKILEVIFEKQGIHFDKYVEERKSFAAQFIINAIKK
jgi:AcrR family transcriptional regulator